MEESSLSPLHCHDSQGQVFGAVWALNQRQPLPWRARGGALLHGPYFTDGKTDAGSCNLPKTPLSKPVAQLGLEPRCPAPSLTTSAVFTTSASALPGWVPLLPGASSGSAGPEALIPLPGSGSTRCLWHGHCVAGRPWRVPPSVPPLAGPPTLCRALDLGGGTLQPCAPWFGTGGIAGSAPCSWLPISQGQRDGWGASAGS